MTNFVAAALLILDWGLPNILGIDLLPQLRRHGVNLPVVCLTGDALADHEALAFERGAADFIDKAHGMEILVSRLRLAMRPRPTTNAAVCDASGHP
jgi:two-component system, OmpR family, response regulator ChvI